jgi:hypothetical protein
VLVQWENTTTAEATWENLADMKDSFPSLNLEDKVVLNGDGIVMNEDATSSQRDPQESKENQSISSGPGISDLRKGMRKRITNSRLKGYVH